MVMATVGMAAMGVTTVRVPALGRTAMRMAVMALTLVIVTMRHGSAPWWR